MKAFFTVLCTAATFGSSFAQSATEEFYEDVYGTLKTIANTAGNPTSTTGDGRQNVPTTTGSQLPVPGMPRTQTTTAPNSGTNTEQEYQRLITEADNYYVRREYAQAIVRYDDALARKNEQYPKDQILRASAEMEQLRKEQQQNGQDVELRSQAEAAANRFNDEYTIHFTGLLISDHFSERTCSQIRKDDEYSNVVLPGKYDQPAALLADARSSTLDGIVVPPGTRLVIYEQPGFQGNVQLDVTGPAIIQNGRWEYDRRYRHTNDQTYTPELQAVYPPSVRTWSTTDMHFWVIGSMEIIIQ